MTSVMSLPARSSGPNVRPSSSGMRSMRKYSSDTSETRIAEMSGSVGILSGMNPVRPLISVGTCPALATASTPGSARSRSAYCWTKRARGS